MALCTYFILVAHHNSCNICHDNSCNSHCS